MSTSAIVKSETAITTNTANTTNNQCNEMDLVDLSLCSSESDDSSEYSQDSSYSDSDSSEYTSSDEDSLHLTNHNQPTRIINSNHNTFIHGSHPKPATKRRVRTSKITVIESIPEFASKVYKTTRKAIKDLYGKQIEDLCRSHVDPRFPQQLTKQTNLMISRRYAAIAGWTEPDGFREMIQNCFDGWERVANRIKRQPSPYKSSKSIIVPVLHGKNINYYYFVYRYNDKDEFNIKDTSRTHLLGSILLHKKSKQQTLKLSNFGISLDSSQIIMGQTSKSHGRAVGKFGEGLKMGACILLYHSHKFSILTNSKNWKFTIKRSKRFHGSDGTMFISPHAKETASPAQVIVTIQNVDTMAIKLDETVNKLKEIYVCKDIERRHFFPLYTPKLSECIRIQSSDGALDGHILTAPWYKNKIFSNGFYIDYDEKCFFGYNINNTHRQQLHLNRDRCLTGQAIRSLYWLIPEYWSHAIQQNELASLEFLKTVGDDNTVCWELPKKSINLNYLLNEQTATPLFKAFVDNIVPTRIASGQFPENINHLKPFIVSKDISETDREKVIKELRRKPLTITVSLYKIFCCSPSFQTVEIALQKQLEALRSCVALELSGSALEFYTHFTAAMTVMFDMLAGYHMVFKRTEMEIRCKIIDKQIIFNAKLLDGMDSEAYQEDKLFVELMSCLGNELKEKKIISRTEFEHVVFAGCYKQIEFQRVERQKADEIQQRLENERRRRMQMEEDQRMNKQMIEMQKITIGKLHQQLSDNNDAQNEQLNAFDDDGRYDDGGGDGYGYSGDIGYDDSNAFVDWNTENDTNHTMLNDNDDNTNNVIREQGTKRRLDELNDTDTEPPSKRRRLNDDEQSKLQKRIVDLHLEMEKNGEVIDNLLAKNKAKDALIQRLEKENKELQTKLDQIRNKMKMCLDAL